MNNDQDLDIAGTEADDDYRRRTDGRIPPPPDPTASPVGAVGDADGAATTALPAGDASGDGHDTSVRRRDDHPDEQTRR